VMSDGGRIVFIGSLLGTHVPFPGAADYAGTKAALIGFAKGVARDLGPRNITVNVVQPGVMPTDMSSAVLGTGTTDFLESLLNLQPIRRIAKLDEVAAMVSHLTSPQAAYMTGSVIDVSGGLAI
jgi:3-oxoacyl-[acyl-carrier protein] reductase